MKVWHGLLLVVLGVLVGFFLSVFKYLYIGRSIEVGHILQMVTVILLFFAANVIYQKLHDRRQKRIELLIDLANDALTEVEKVHSAFAECNTGGAISGVARQKLDSALSGYSNAISYSRGRAEALQSRFENAHVERSEAGPGRFQRLSHPVSLSNSLPNRPSSRRHDVQPDPPSSTPLSGVAKPRSRMNGRFGASHAG